MFNIENNEIKRNNNKTFDQNVLMVIQFVFDAYERGNFVQLTKIYNCSIFNCIF